MTKEWFETWFDTRYYHILYGHRDENEARQFIDALLSFLKPSEDARFLDVACGKGRHSKQINTSGFDVTGIDLSVNSIALANQFASDTLRFIVQDIREDMGSNKYDYALNLFTSFGYFENTDQHISALKNIHRALKPQGIFVFDYLNVDQVNLEGASKQRVETEDIQFEIRKSIQYKQIIKQIAVTEKGSTRHFQERVMAFSKAELEYMLGSAGFAITKVFGDYNLSAYNKNAPRVIIIAKK